MEKKLTWSQRKNLIYCAGGMFFAFLVLTLNLVSYGGAGIFMGVVTGCGAIVSLIFFFCHVYIVFFYDME